MIRLFGVSFWGDAISHKRPFLSSGFHKYVTGAQIIIRVSGFDSLRTLQGMCSGPGVKESEQSALFAGWEGPSHPDCVQHDSGFAGGEAEGIFVQHRPSGLEIQEGGHCPAHANAIASDIR